MVQEYGLFINGRWRKSEGKRFETRNPATGEVLASFPLATNEGVALAVKSAKAAFEKWRRTPAPRRGELPLQMLRESRLHRSGVASILGMTLQNPRDGLAQRLFKCTNVLAADGAPSIEDAGAGRCSGSKTYSHFAIR